MTVPLSSSPNPAFRFLLAALGQIVRAAQLQATSGWVTVRKGCRLKCNKFRYLKSVFAAEFATSLIADQANNRLYSF